MPSAKPDASPRTMLAMQFGDNCWLKDLTKRPELNGLRVMLHTWHDERQRWQAKPQGWEFEEEFICVRPRNLSKDPVPIWALRATEEIAPTDQLTPTNTEVVCHNANDFASVDMPVPPAPAWSSVQRTVKQQKRTKKQRDEDDARRQQLALKLEALVKREVELRKGVMTVIDLEKFDVVDVETTLKHMCCMKETLLTQMELFERAGRYDLVEKGQQQLATHQRQMDPVLKAWAEKGEGAVDFWKDSD